MSLDGLIGAIALAAAIYAMSDEGARVRFSLEFRLIQVSNFLCCFLLIIYLQFFRLFQRGCPDVLGDLCSAITFTPEGPISPAETSFFVLIFWFLSSFIIHKRTPLGIGSVIRFKNLLIDLIANGKFSEAAKIFESQQMLLRKVRKRKFLFQSLSAAAEERNSIEYLIGSDQSIGDSEKLFVRKFNDFIYLNRRWLRFVLPTYRLAEEAVSDLIFELQNSRKIIEEIALGSCAKFYKFVDFRDIYFNEFFHEIITTMIRERGSKIYYEIQIDSYISNGRFEFRATQPILQSILADPKISFDLGIWKPFGDEMLRHSDPRQFPECIGLMNKSGDHFDDAKNNDPVWIGLVVFSIMLKNTLKSQINFHMWIMYLSLLICNLERLCRRDLPDVDYNAEFPVVASRYIYEALDILRDCVEARSDLSCDHSHRTFHPIEDSHRTFIPESAAIELGKSYYAIVCSQNIDENFKVYMVECLLSTIESVFREEVDEEWHSFVVSSILLPKTGLLQRSGDEGYLRELRRLMMLGRTRGIYGVSEFQDALEDIIRNYDRTEN